MFNDASMFSANRAIPSAHQRGGTPRSTSTRASGIKQPEPSPAMKCSASSGGMPLLRGVSADAVAKTRQPARRTRLGPNTAPAHTDRGATIICATACAVVIHAASSKPRPSAPRMSANPKLERRPLNVVTKAPNKTAPSPRVARKPKPDFSADAITAPPSLADSHARRHRHARTKHVAQFARIVERDLHSDTLDHLCEVAGRIVWRQQCKLRASAGSEPDHVTGESMPRKRIDRDRATLTDSHPAQLGLLEIREHPNTRQCGHDCHLLADGDVLADAHLARTGDAVVGRDDSGVLQIEFRKLTCGTCCRDRGVSLPTLCGKHVDLAQGGVELGACLIELRATLGLGRLCSLLSLL